MKLHWGISNLLDVWGFIQAVECEHRLLNNMIYQNQFGNPSFYGLQHWAHFLQVVEEKRCRRRNVLLVVIATSCDWKALFLYVLSETAKRSVPFVASGSVMKIQLHNWELCFLQIVHYKIPCPYMETSLQIAQQITFFCELSNVILITFLHKFAYPINFVSGNCHERLFALGHHPNRAFCLFSWILCKLFFGITFICKWSYLITVLDYANLSILCWGGRFFLDKIWYDYVIFWAQLWLY